MTRVPMEARRNGRVSVGFDLDGVLMRNPFETCVLPRLSLLLKTTPGLSDLGEQEAARAVRKLVATSWRRRMGAADLVGAYDWDAIYREVAQEFGGAPELSDSIDVAAWVVECCGGDGHIEALPGAKQALEGLQAAGARAVVITNGFAAYQEPVLEALDLLRYFDAVITPERAGAAKPDTRIFESAGHLDYFVGDTLVHDVLGANSAGITSVWLPPDLPEELAKLTPKKRAEHQELPNLLQRSLVASPHTTFHPEANVDTCRPDFVLKRVDEVVELVAG